MQSQWDTPSLWIAQCQDKSFASCCSVMQELSADPQRGFKGGTPKLGSRLVVPTLCHERTGTNGDPQISRATFIIVH